MKTYTIKHVSELMNLPASTIRYYDSEGLLPFMQRKESGIRIFSDIDIAMLRIIECLKKTGMPIKDIKQYSDWAQQGDKTLNERHQMFLERKKVVEKQLAELQETLDLVNHKCNYYEKAVAAGTESIHYNGLDFQEFLQLQEFPIKFE